MEFDSSKSQMDKHFEKWKSLKVDKQIGTEGEWN